MENTFLPTQAGQAASCHQAPQFDLTGMPVIAIVGSPNVGKSVLYHKLTGIYATVSNYPGTTVEVMRGRARLGAVTAGVLDTPGMYSLSPITEEERVARQILLREHLAVVVQVVDAKNLERMLPLTLQLREAGLPLVLVVNLLDEAERLGIEIDIASLQRRLGIVVVGAALARNRGVAQVRSAIQAVLTAELAAVPSVANASLVQYPQPVEIAIAQITPLLAPGRLSNRATAALLLQGDAEIIALVHKTCGSDYDAIAAAIRQAQAQFDHPLNYVMQRSHRQAAGQIWQRIYQHSQGTGESFASRLSDWMIHPLTGIPILLAALFLLYEFVGVLGAQVLVGWLEGTLFGQYINPWVAAQLARWLPWPALQALIGGEFGIITLGLRYAVAIILPIVGTFFLAFSIFEDSGYLPRLAMLIDRLFKIIGLNGRAVIPMVLGFGCDTMATITTRTLETHRERVISTLLLSLAIPCSAQLGVMLALLSFTPWLLAGWALVVGGIFLLIGYLARQLLPGRQPVFFMELPPLRLPSARNVLVKTYTRMEWYLREIFPVFIIASLVIWIGMQLGIFEMAVAWLAPVMRWLGLPEQTAMAFLFGFFRRDYGAAGLYDMRAAMSPAQLLVAVTVLTLFVPCVAQFAVMIKERGPKTALAMAAFIFPFALLVGGVMAAVLRLGGFDL